MKTVLARWRTTVARGCAALVLALSGAAAHAQVTCSMDGTPDWNLNFGTHTGSVNDVTSADSLSFICSNSGQDARNVKICVGLGAGSGSTTTLNRRMSHGANTISYQIYRDEARSQRFGSGTGTNAAEFVGSVGGGGVPVPLPTPIRLYGRIPAPETPVPGTYTSTFTSTDVQIKYTGYAAGSPAPNCTSVSSNGQEIPYNGGFTASVNVLAACEITHTVPVNFGAQTALANNVDASGRVGVNCTNTADYLIAINDGLNAQNGQRHMRHVSAPNLIAYELYQAPYTQRWGSLGAERLQGTGSGSEQLHLIHARVPGGQPLPILGDYTDTVVVTVHY